MAVIDRALVRKNKRKENCCCISEKPEDVKDESIKRVVEGDMMAEVFPFSPLLT